MLPLHLQGLSNSGWIRVQQAEPEPTRLLQVVAAHTRAINTRSWAWRYRKTYCTAQVEVSAPAAQWGVAIAFQEHELPIAGTMARQAIGPGATEAVHVVAASQHPTHFRVLASLYEGVRTTNLLRS